MYGTYAETQQQRWLGNESTRKIPAGRTMAGPYRTHEPMGWTVAAAAGAMAAAVNDIPNSAYIHCIFNSIAESVVNYKSAVKRGVA